MDIFPPWEWEEWEATVYFCDFNCLRFLLFYYLSLKIQQCGNCCHYYVIILITEVLTPSFSVSKTQTGASQVVLVVKNLPANAGDIKDAGSILGLGRSPGGGNGNPLQHSRLENPKDRGAWQVIVHEATKGQTWLKWLSTAQDSKTQTKASETLSCTCDISSEKSGWNGRRAHISQTFLHVY